MILSFIFCRQFHSLFELKQKTFTKYSPKVTSLKTDKTDFTARSHLKTPI